MYRANPFTYIVSTLLSTTLANSPVQCSFNEYLVFSSPSNQTCGQYMESYTSTSGGYLLNPEAQGEKCSFCRVNSTDEFLAGLGVNFANRWRDFGFLWCFICFNIVAAVFLYRIRRVPRKKAARI